MAQTLLQLVNRLRRKLREQDTSESGFESDDLNLVLRDLVNDAGEMVLGQNEWSFEVRHDGVLHTVEDLTTAAASTFVINVTNYPNNTRVNNLIGTSLNDNMTVSTPTQPVWRLIFGDATNPASPAPYPDTAFTVLQTWVRTTGFAILAEKIPPSGFLGTARTLANEYLLPTNVRRVLSMKHQERDVRLEEMGRSQGFDRYIRRPQETVSDDPDMVVVSGRRVPTLNLGIVTDPNPEYAAPDSGQSVLIYPTPSSQLVLHYSYVYAYPRLDAVTDTWEGIDSMVESAIVDLAYARAMQTDVGKDPEAGIVLEQRTRNDVRQLLAMDQQMPGYRRELHGHFCSEYGPYSPGRYPRNFGSTS